jgi:hypothetical protein
VASNIILTLFVVIAPFAFRGAQIAELPDVGDPFDVVAFGTVAIKEEDNAFPLYANATAKLTELNWELRDSAFDALETGWQDVPAEVKQWHQDNQPALAMWREAASRPDILVVQPKELNGSNLVKLRVSGFSNFSLLAELEALRPIDAGDFENAWYCYRDIIRFSRHLQLHAPVDGYCAGAIMFHRAFEGIRRLIEYSAVNPMLLEQIRADTERLTSPLPSDALKSEYYLTMNLINDRRYLPELLDVKDTKEWIALETGKFAFNEPEASRRLLRIVFARWLHSIDQPLQLRGRQISDDFMLYEAADSLSIAPNMPSASLIERELNNRVLARSFTWRIRWFDQLALRERTERRLLQFLISAHRYQREFGEFPASADELVNRGYLPSIPGDPFHRDLPLRYRRDESSPNSAVVWSIGPDCVDDGGTDEWDSSIKRGDMLVKVRIRRNQAGAE